MRDDGAAEIAVREPCQIKPVLHDDRAVETEVVAQLLVQRLVDAMLAGHGFDRITGNEAHEHEHEQRYPDEGRNDQADACEQKPQHAKRKRGGAAAAPSPRYFMSTP